MLSAVAARADSNGILHLSAGDFVAGHFVPSAAPDVVQWQGTHFTAPFQFTLNDVRSIVFPQPEDLPQPRGEICFELTRGGVIYGELLGVTDDAITVQESKFGRISVRRDHLRRMFRWKSGSELLYVGPNGLEGWTDSNTASVWREAGNHIVTDQTGAKLTRDFKLPAETVLEIELSWSNRPNFVLALGVAGDLDSLGQAFRLEVIGSELVAVRETKGDADIAVVTQIGPAAGHVHLLIYLDQQRGRMLVYSMTGAQLADLHVADKKPHVGGRLSLLNIAGDIQLERLRINHWNGVAPTNAGGTEPRFQRAGGKVESGHLIGFDAASKTLTFQTSGGETAVPLGDIDDVLLVAGAEEPMLEPSRNLHVIYQDGTRISGQLVSTGESNVVLKSPEVVEDVAAPLAELRGLTVMNQKTESAAAPRGLGTLELPDTKLHGQLLNGREEPGASCLVWKPLGSETASPLRKEVSGRIAYRTPPAKPKKPRSPTVNRRQAQVKMLDVGKLEPGKAADAPQPAAAKRPIKEDSMLHLRSGDTIPCAVKAIDEAGVTFATSMSDATFVPHEKIKAIELVKSKTMPKLAKQKKERLLTLPRMQRDSPPTQLVYSRNGDFLRGRIIAMNDAELVLEVRLDERRIDRDRIADIIWLHNDELGGQAGAPKENEQTDSNGNTDEAVGADSETEPAPAEGGRGDRLGEAKSNVDAKEAAPTLSGTRIQVQRSDGIRLTFVATEFQDETLSGRSDVLGECRSSLAQIDQLLIGDAIEQVAATLAWHRWKLHHAVDPKFVQEENSGGEPGVDSPLVGKPAPDFTLDFLSGEKFHLADCKGQVVVLDFWATWCGPCLQVMPQVEAVVAEFEATNVRLVAVNLEEAPQQIKATLERHKLNVAVVLDQDGVVAHRYQANAIPQTVIIDREGNVARLFIGGGPDYADELRAALQEVTGAKPAGEANPPGAPADAEAAK
jgi:peroxiredoxin